MVRTEKPQEFSGQIVNVKKLLIARALKRIQQRFISDFVIEQIQSMFVAELRRQKIPHEVLQMPQPPMEKHILCFGWLLVTISSEQTTETLASSKMQSTLQNGGWRSGFHVSPGSERLIILPVDRQ